MLDIKQKKISIEYELKHAIVDVTEDHSLLDQNREVIKPSDLFIGDELLHNHYEFC